MQVIIFGTGKKYIENKRYFQNMQIVAFLDNDKEKQGTYVDGHIVDMPENIEAYAYDYVVLASIYYKEMREQLLQLGVLPEKIIDREHRGVWAAIRRVTRFSVPGGDVTGKRILLVTHGMGLNGAPIVLLEMGKVFIKAGYSVELYSSLKGPLAADFLQAGITVNFFDDFDFDADEISTYFCNYDLIIVNTVTLYELVEKIKDRKIPIIWWLHEADWYMKQYSGFKAMTDSHNLHVWAVSKISQNAFENFCNLKVEMIMPFGMKDVSVKTNSYHCKNIVFAVIGSVEERKAQDVFLQAAELVGKKYLNVEFWIIGSDQNSYAMHLKQQYASVSQIVWMSELGHDEVMQLYSEIDVCVCPSREETMSMVTVEAMMNSRPVIVSDKTGIADFIEPEVSGLIFESENVEELAQKMTRCIEDFELREYMGSNGRRIFKDIFNVQQFEQKVLREIGKLI